MNVAGALLAAGSSRRLGQPKQLLSLDGGGSLVRHAAEALLDSGVARAGVVLDRAAPDVAAALSDLEVDHIFSPAPAEGIAASIRAAVSWASALGARALLLSVCDQPRLASGHLRRLVAAFRAERSLVASYYCGAAAVPALFPADHFPLLAELRGDAGAAKLLRSALRLTLIAWPDGAEDLDRPEDVARFRAMRRGERAL